MPSLVPLASIKHRLPQDCWFVENQAPGAFEGGIRVCGDLVVSQLFWGDYNHWSLRVDGQARVQVWLLTDEYDAQVRGKLRAEVVLDEEAEDGSPSDEEHVAPYFAQPLMIQLPESPGEARHGEWLDRDAALECARRGTPLLQPSFAEAPWPTRLSSQHRPRRGPPSGGGGGAMRVAGGGPRGGGGRRGGGGGGGGGRVDSPTAAWDLRLRSPRARSLAHGGPHLARARWAPPTCVPCRRGARRRTRSAASPAKTSPRPP